MWRIGLGRIRDPICREKTMRSYQLLAVCLLLTGNETAYPQEKKSTDEINAIRAFELATGTELKLENKSGKPRLMVKDPLTDEIISRLPDAFDRLKKGMNAGTGRLTLRPKNLDENWIKTIKALLQGG